MRQGQVPFDQYLSDIEASGSTQDILENIQRGTLKAYHGLSDEIYNKMGQGQTDASTSQGFYQPASMEGDTARIFLRPLHEPNVLSHEGSHDLVGHDLDAPNTPKLSWWDMLDKKAKSLQIDLDTVTYDYLVGDVLVLTGKARMT